MYLFVCLFVSEGAACNKVHVAVKRQLAGVGSLISPCGFGVWPGHQAPQNAPLPA